MPQEALLFEREYAYRPTWTGIALGSLFFGLCLAIFIYLAATNEKPVVFAAVIRLTPFAGRIFFGLLAVACGVFVLLSLAFIAFRLTSAQRIAFNADGILLPIGRWFQRQETLVRYADIQAVKTVEAHSNRYVYVYANGLRYTILGAWLGAGNLDEILWLLKTRVPGEFTHHKLS